MSGLGTLHGVGVGPGDPELLTLRAARLLGEAAVVFAAASSKNDYSVSFSIVGPHIGEHTTVERLDFPMTRDKNRLEAAWNLGARRVLGVLETGRDAVFITLGDPMTYSTFLYLARTLRALRPDVRLSVTPGISSVQAAAAAAGMGLAESAGNFAVLSGVDDPERLRRSLEAADTAVILKAYRTYPALRALLIDMGLADKAVLVSRLGLPGQAVVRGLGDESVIPPYFSLILVQK